MNVLITLALLAIAAWGALAVALTEPGALTRYRRGRAYHACARHAARPADPDATVPMAAVTTSPDLTSVRHA